MQELPRQLPHQEGLTALTAPSSEDNQETAAGHAPAAAPVATPVSEFVWDWPTRLAHVLFIVLVGLCWWSAEERQMDLHQTSGLILLGVIVFRIFWGFFGPETARFSRFVKGPRAVIAYARSLFSRDHKLAFGHNPLGALSVIALLLVLSAQVGLGLFSVDTDGLESGPLARHVSYETADEITDLHEDNFDILLILIGLHLAAVAFYAIVKHANLIGPMITGRRKLTAHTEPSPRRMAPAPITRIALGIAIAVLAVWFVTR